MLIISTPQGLLGFKVLLGNGYKFGNLLFFTSCSSPDGLAQTSIISDIFIGKNTVAMVLGDNIFAGYRIKKAESSCQIL